MLRSRHRLLAVASLPRLCVRDDQGVLLIPIRSMLYARIDRWMVRASCGRRISFSEGHREVDQDGWHDAPPGVVVDLATSP